MTLAVFTEPAQLINAFLTFHPDGKLPHRVMRVPLADGTVGWALDRALFGEELKRYATQYGWKGCSVQARPSAAPPDLSILDLVMPQWTYRDPAENAGLPQQMEGDDAIQSAIYRPFAKDSDHFHILAAKGATESQRLLTLLTDSLAQGLKACALPMEPDPAGCPWEFFWLIRSRYADPFILRQASRCWWGPIGRGDPQVFVQWPYSVSIPSKVLAALPWGQDARYVLLSKDPPHHLIMRRLGQAEVFRDLAESARLVTGSPAVVKDLAPVSPSDRVELRVRLRLTDQPPARRLVARINDLEQELAARNAVLQRLRENDVAVVPPRGRREPLLFYPVESGSDEPPIALRRLLTEWVDFDTGLRSVYYAKIEAEQVPPGLFGEGKDLHVLTSGRAIGKPDAGQVGAQLWDYRMDASLFQLCPEWEHFDLRLFLPAGRYLEIYPDLRPTARTGQRLKEVILDGADPSCLAVLAQDGERRMHVLRLRTGEFQPLVQAWRWGCALDLELDAPRLLTGTVGRGLPPLRHALMAACASLRPAAQGYIAGRIAAVEKGIAPLDTRLRNLDRRISGSGGLREKLDKQQEKETTIKEELTRYESAVTPIARLVDELRTEVRELSSQVQQGRNIAQTLDAVRRTLDQLRSALP